MWLKVLYLIKKGDGSNEHVEKEHSLKANVLNKDKDLDDMQAMLEEVDVHDIVEDTYGDGSSLK